MIKNIMMYSGLAYYYCINSIAPSLPADTFLPFRSATQSNMQTQWLSLPPSICLSLSLCRSCHGFMHMKFSQSRDGKFILGENSPPFDSIPEVIHYYTTNKLPIRGAEHLSLLFPVLVQTLWDHTHTHTYHVLTHRHTQGFTRTATTVLHFQSHIAGSSRIWLVFGWGIRFFRRVIRFIPGVKESTVGLYWHCIDVLHACAEYILHHWTLKCLRITLGTAILLSMLQTLQIIDLTFEDKM